MTDKCFEVEQIAEILELPDDDPRRRHANECPRCNSIMLSYLMFLEADAAAGSDPADAEAHLAAFLESNVRHPAHEVSGPTTGRESFFFTLARRLFARPPEWAAAALVAVALAIVAAAVIWWQPWAPERPVLRSSTPDQSGQPLYLLPSQTLSDGGVRLSWRPMDGADGYQVRFYGDDLGELARLEPVAGTTVVVRRSILPSGAPPTVLWRVIAFQGGDEIGVSSPARLELR